MKTLLHTPIQTMISLSKAPDHLKIYLE